MSNFPSFFEQLQEDMNRNPQKYVVGYDAYQMHRAQDMGLWIKDSTKYANVIYTDPEYNVEKDRHDYYRDYLMKQKQREQESQLAATRREELRREQEVQNRKENPLSYLGFVSFVDGIDIVFKNISKIIAK